MIARMTYVAILFIWLRVKNKYGGQAIFEVPVEMANKNTSKSNKRHNLQLQDESEYKKIISWDKCLNILDT